MDREAPVREESERRVASLPAAPKLAIGMTRGQIEALLGPPAFLRRDPPAEFRRYRSESCILELYFYPSGRRHVLKHLEIRKADGREVDSERCLQNIANGRSGRRQSNRLPGGPAR